LGNIPFSERLKSTRLRLSKFGVRVLGIVITFVAILASVLNIGSATAPPTVATSGTFSVLTYNVAGLPDILSSGNPAENTTTIGQRINSYDIVQVQEDFNYHADLYSTDQHPFRTSTSGPAGFGDGLNTVSNYSFMDFQRVDWAACNGTDCLTPKGFTFMRIRLAEGVYVDFYNLHTNAGTTDADLSARRSNITQLSNFIAANSAGNAVIVMGDTNTRYTRSGDNIRDLAGNNGLTDAWVSFVRGGTPPVAGSEALTCDPADVNNYCEVVDKILYRGNRFISLNLVSYANENAAFLDADDEPLSDHYPISARFTWTLNPSLRMSDQFGGPHGALFTDVDKVAIGAQTRTVSIRAGSRVDQVGITLNDGTSLTHGGTGGTANSLTLGSGEYLTQVMMNSDKRDGHTRIFYIEFRTNLGRTLSGGTRTSNAVTYTAPEGWQIVGFHGRSGNELDKLGFIYTPRN
jgi:hypothetical protein